MATRRAPAPIRALVLSFLVTAGIAVLWGVPSLLATLLTGRAS
ncbi:hypothetical protein ACFVTX_18040 [Agromyces sp. NPDC058136]